MFPPRRIFRPQIIIAVLLCSVACRLPADDAFFESRIRPVLVKHCYECHSDSADIIQAGLRLDAPEAMRKGGESGQIIVPGDPESSLLVSSLKYEGIEMPPSGPLDERIVKDFERWVRTGAKDPRPKGSPTSLAPSESNQSADSLDRDAIDWQQAKQFWAFRRPVEHAIPPAIQPWRSDHWIDRFIQQRLQVAGLKPSPLATRRVLIRRLAFDLTGLPPTIEQVDQFVYDARPNAYERAVDRLLSSPRQAEHFARLWLDVARYAEDQAHVVGNNDSLTYPNAYLYRDWVIEASATDMPYDEFVRMQLAADQYKPDDLGAHLALGFLGLGPKYYRRSSPEVMADEWEDRIDTVSRGLLGLTVACARCHDHKYDPIATEDYYALAGVFASTKMFNRPINETVKKKGDEAAKPQDAHHILREGNATDLNVYIRGDVNRKGNLVARRFLQVLSSEEPRRLDHGSGRIDLAEAIVDSNNPLAARVIVNRVWRQLMGRGLVETPSNFGSLGERPTHHELLDTLAVRFMQQGWSLKWLHRQIVLSSTYQQSGLTSLNAMDVDPDNRLLWRMAPKRVSIEQLRDSWLIVVDRLGGEIGGKSIEPDDPTKTRRTLYSKVSRLDLNPMLGRFDFPDPNAHSAKRVETTTPLQKLFLMNSDFVSERAKELAEQSHSSTLDIAARIELLYQTLFSRSPTGEEVRHAETYLASNQEERWVQYAQVLLISNEMLFID